MKKKGSSLITVIIFMMFLMIVGTTAITTTMMDYKARVNESKRIENLYGAESGLEIAYDILLKTSDYAINQAVDVTNKQFAIDETKPETERVNLNDLFKKTYLKALFDGTYSHQLAAPQSLTDGLTTFLLKNLNYLTLNENSKIEFQSSGFHPSEKNITIEVELRDSNNNVINNFNQVRETFTVKVTSFFESTDENVHVGNNERKVSRTFEFDIPDYTQALVDLYPVFNGKALTVDGNLSLTGSVSNPIELNITGDVWVGGDICTNISNCSTQITDVSYQKYENGILLEDATLTINGVLSTKETLALRNKANVTLAGNMYGRNIYIGKKDVAAQSTGSRLRVTGTDGTKYDVVLSNDLAINVSSSSSVHSTVVLDKFYGISDKNVSSTDIKLDDVNTLAQESSSILVNAEGASVEITDEAFIGGLAFIDVMDANGNKYQTGESVAVKPNYLAYTMVANDLEEQLTFRYYDPLMLVESIEEMSKSEYFVKVNSDGLLSMSSGGIKLPSNVYSAGAIVQDGKAQPSQGMIDQAVEVQKEKTEDYVKYVQLMNGRSSNLSEARTVANQIKWTASGFNENIYTSETGTVILNKEPNQEVIIRESNGTHTVQIGLQAPREITGAVFLVTKGNLKLVGNVKLTGNFVVSGHVSVDPNVSESYLTYDEDCMKSLLIENENVFKDLFIDSGKETVSGGSTEDADYSATTIITKGRWQLVK